MYQFFEKGKLNYNCVFNSTWCQIVLAIFTAMAFFNNKSLPVYEEMVKSAGTDNSIGVFFAKLNFVFNGYNLLCLLVVIGIVYVYKKFFSQVLRFDKTAFIVASLFAIIMLFGDSFKIVGTWDLVFRDGFQVFISTIYFIGYTVLFYVGISWLFSWLDKCSFMQDEKPASKVTVFVFNKYPFICCWLILLLAWSPYLIFFYPGSLDVDAFTQVLQFYKEWSLQNNHPIFSTFIIGICVKFGQNILSDNFGIFIYTLLQSIVFSASLAFAISQLRYFNTSVGFRKLCLMFFALCPVFPGYAQYVVKDTLYISVLLFFSVLFVRLIQKPDLWFDYKYKLSLGILAILLCLLRHNGIHIVIISGLLFLCIRISKKIKIQFGAGLIFLCIFFYCYNSFVIPLFGVTNTTSTAGAILPIPFQQTARYVKYHSDEITYEEREILNEIFDYNLLAESYDPEKSDAISRIYKYPEAEKMQTYFQLWFKQLLNHPGTYIQAAIHKFYGYFYPDIDVYNYRGFGFRVDITPYVVDYTDFMNLYMIDKWQPIRNFICNFMYCFQKIPVFGLLYSIGIYTWILMLMLAYLIRIRHFQSIIAYMPAILTLLICIVSPVNRYLRYYMPVITMIPILVAYFLYVLNNIDKKSTVKKTKAVRL